MRHLEKMLEERPAELVELLLHRPSPAFAELLTSKLEEHAAQPDGERFGPIFAVERYPDHSGM